MMRMLLAIIVLSCLFGCGMTDTQKKWAGVAAGVLIVGAIAAHDDDKDYRAPAATNVSTPTVTCTPALCN